MFTRTNTDACSISDRDIRNREIYDWNLDNIPAYRRGAELNSQIYASTTGGVEKDFNLESQLQGLFRVANDCNLYGAGVQANLQASAPPEKAICIGNALAPEYTKTTRVARNTDIYMSSRAKPLDWHFYTPAVPFVSYGTYSVNRWSDTVQNTKDQISAQNKQLIKQYWGSC